MFQRRYCGLCFDQSKLWLCIWNWFCKDKECTVWDWLSNHRLIDYQITGWKGYRCHSIYSSLTFLCCQRWTMSLVHSTILFWIISPHGMYEDKLGGKFKKNIIFSWWIIINCLILISADGPCLPTHNLSEIRERL